MNPIVQIKDVKKRYGPVTALSGIDLSVIKGEIVTLLGPSGCGKTTLMRLIAGFEQPSEGSVLLEGRNVTKLPPELRPVNMVFQRYALFPHLDVFDNIAFGLRLKGTPTKEIKAKVTTMLHMVQLDGFGNRWINELSGGQAQRVALARALVNSPSVLLLDEPLAALDLKIRHHMLHELKRIHAETGTTFVYVTHDQDEAMILSDRVVLMNKGCIEQIGSPEQMYSRPKTLFGAKFFGDTNIIPGTVTSADPETTLVDIGCCTARAEMNGVKPGQSVFLSIRPELMHIEKAAKTPSTNANFIEGMISDVTFIGSRVVYEIKNEELTVKYQTAKPIHTEGIADGDKVRVSWSSSDVVVLTH
ncbi:ABC transporter ATP-binding protein [Agrobacterium larrymoorei]|uniref:Spermidine/putrescine import ATP-binding protein PotA n=1 Tax=Agrobacterium larrymoorei TaxID=160699 RepID=A0A4D7DU92_9HYPH|nr:ABC transporter ATP-binding protein [Agrobacterium larrymoorei]QCJ01106.1 ABC transporter ATP-binding protein [Agrobacterium larrymoorei]QYA10119.1 ABC transporter ATP-binding protein [Agrobacterium larrymoorei]